jgi:hypothetical protein
MRAVDVEREGDSLRFGVPRVLFVLFEYPGRNSAHIPAFRPYAVSRDGQRFFVLQAPTTAETFGTPLTVVTNWTSALEQ